METPHTDHLTVNDYEDVYEPAEDSFLLLDALEADLPYLQTLWPTVCVEIGSGSGVIITALAKTLRASCLCLATDINPVACRATQRTAQRNSVGVEAIQCNLVDVLQPNSIDLLLFNPPYVVTTDEELQQNQSGNLLYSWAGGRDGRRITDELLAKLSKTLSPRGVFYLLLLRENKPEDVIRQLRKSGFKTEKFMERRIPGEYLYILKITRELN